jgi:uncharacterized protein YkwD
VGFVDQPRQRESRREDEEGQDMGRHRRSAAGRAATGRATEATAAHGSAAGSQDPQHSYPGDRPEPGIAPYPNPEAYAEAVTRSDAYLFATDATGPTGPAAGSPEDGGYPAEGGASRGRAHRRRKKAATPVRTGLLGVSAAVALGTVAVATGVLPGGESYTLGGSGADKVQTSDTPGNTGTQQGGASASIETGAAAGGTTTSPGTGRSASPSASPSKTSKTSAEPSTEAPSKKPRTEPSAKKPKPAQPTRTAQQTPPKATPKPEAPVTVSAEAAAEAEVLRLVNEERARAGCSPVAANSALAGLAGDFSRAMAEQGFFDHTDPSGATPWDRAEQAGITNLGGENIARGQADAASVMEAWMNSPGHRANILNCDFKTLGVGVHHGSGGPWWTQNFGY